MRPSTDTALSAASRAASSQDVTQTGLAIPILLVVFNRPDTTRAVFESIRRAQPRQLFVAADGPRVKVNGEEERCLEARAIATGTDWPCTVRTFFRGQNVGAAVNVSEAVTWFFATVDAGIVLEDDCVPNPSFYMFCRELLSYYENDPLVMHISGNNFQYGRVRGDASYYFSRYPLSWGWATWRRAWDLYDFNLRPEWELQDAWDTQWLLTLRKYAGMAVTPQVNLVTNVGFGPGATHTKTIERYSFLRAREMEFPLVHPTSVRVDEAADTFTYYAHFRNVRYLRLIPVYQVLDLAIRTMKRIKRELLGLLSRVARTGKTRDRGEPGGNR